jgi:hypothetical protein
MAWVLLRTRQREDTAVKKFLIAISFLLAVGMGTEAKANGPHFHSGLGRYHAGWGWHPLVGVGVLPIYGFSYYPFFGPLVRYATFGSISYSISTGRTGWSWGDATLEGSVSNANQFCGVPDCRGVVWVQGGCAAVSTSADGSRLGWGYDGSRSQAQSRSLRACRAGSRGALCTGKAWVCSWN